MKLWLAVIAISLAACSGGRRYVGPGEDGGQRMDAHAEFDGGADPAFDSGLRGDAGHDAGPEPQDAGPRDAGPRDAGSLDAGPLDAGHLDAGVDAGFDAGGTPQIDVEIYVHHTCVVSTTPASITVPTGTDFTVNWVNRADSAANVDIDKIDPFNAVPIIIGLEPGGSHHDSVREWCGSLFTGTFSFRITGCFEPYYLPVDCGGP